jgi:hypothetical protein
MTIILLEGHDRAADRLVLDGDSPSTAVLS